MMCETQLQYSKDEFPLKNQSFKLQAFNSLSGSKPKYQLQVARDHHNKLPVNLLHSPAEYNKLLITNGRNLGKRKQSQISGFIEDLQYVNQPIFQSFEETRLELRHRYKQNHHKTQKQKNSHTQSCQCCCCDQYCSLCVDQQKANSVCVANFPSQNLKEIRTKIESELKKKKTLKNMKKNKKVVTSKKQIQFSKEKIKSNEDSVSSSYLPQKTMKIDNLICDSLIKFQEQKRDKQIKGLHEKKEIQARRRKMKVLEQQIRQYNRMSKSKPKSNSHGKTSKSKKAVEYWQSIRQKLKQELSMSNLSNNKQLLIKSVALECHPKSKLSRKQIENLKKKHQKQALLKISEIKYKQIQQQNNKSKKLKDLEKHRKQHLSTCKKKKFEPSQQMIENAFMDLNK